MNRTPVPQQWGTSYEAWIERSQDALHARDWSTAFKEYPWLNFSDSPLTPLRRSLSDSRIALISSGGISVGDQNPFDAEDPLGDHSFRVVAAEGPLRSWRVDHAHYDVGPPRVDYNTVFPLDALSALAAQGVIGAIAPEHYTFMGYQPDPRPFYEMSAPSIVEGLAQHQVDGVLLVPG